MTRFIFFLALIHFVRIGMVWKQTSCRCEMTLIGLLKQKYSISLYFSFSILSKVVNPSKKPMPPHQILLGSGEVTLVSIPGLPFLLCLHMEVVHFTLWVKPEKKPMSPHQTQQGMKRRHWFLCWVLNLKELMEFFLMWFVWLNMYMKSIVIEKM